MVTTLASTAPGVDPRTVIATGATQIRTAFPPEQVPGIVLAYMAGIKVTFALTVGLVGFTCLVGLFVPWKRLNADALKESGGVA